MSLVKETFTLSSNQGNVLIKLEAEGEPDDIERLEQMLRSGLKRNVKEVEKTTSVELTRKIE